MLPPALLDGITLNAWHGVDLTIEQREFLNPDWESSNLRRWTELTIEIRAALPPYIKHSQTDLESITLP